MGTNAEWDRLLAKSHPGRRSLLYLDPAGPATVPVIDALTRKMAAALNRGVPPDQGYRWRGFHGCECGAMSSNYDLSLPDARFATNSLAVHYVACHRARCEAWELSVISGWTEEAEPTQEQLHGWHLKRG